MYENEATPSKRTVSMSTVALDDDDDGDLDSSLEEELEFNAIVQVKNTFITLAPMLPTLRRQCSAPAL